MGLKRGDSTPFIVVDFGYKPDLAPGRETAPLDFFLEQSMDRKREHWSTRPIPIFSQRTLDRMEHYGTPIGYGVSAGLAAGLAHGYLGKNQGLGVLFRYVPAGAAAGYLYARHTRGREKRSHFLGSGLGKEAGIWPKFGPAQAYTSAKRAIGVVRDAPMNLMQKAVGGSRYGTLDEFAGASIYHKNPMNMTSQELAAATARPPGMGMLYRAGGAAATVAVDNAVGRLVYHPRWVDKVVRSKSNKMVFGGDLADMGTALQLRAQTANIGPEAGKRLEEAFIRYRGALPEHYEGLRALDSKAVNRKLVIHQAKKALGRPT